jgi:hypothetical protein
MVENEGNKSSIVDFRRIMITIFNALKEDIQKKKKENLNESQENTN